MKKCLFLAILVLGYAVFAQENNVQKKMHGKHSSMTITMSNMADDIVILMNQLKKNSPKEYERLENLRKTNRGQYFAEIRKLLPQNNEAMQAMMENERQCRQLAMQIKNTTDKEAKAKLETALREKIVANFDATIQDATIRLQKMEKRIEDLKENRKDILDARYQAFIQLASTPRSKPQRDNQEEPEGKKAKNARPIPPPPPIPELPTPSK